MLFAKLFNAHCSDTWISLRLHLLFVLCSLAHSNSSCGQEAREPATGTASSVAVGTTPPTVETPAALALETTGNYSLSAAVERNYELDEILQTILKAIQDEEHSSLARLLTESLTTAKRGYVEYRGVLHRFNPLLVRLAFHLPADSLAAYRRESSQSAKVAMEEAQQSRDVVALQKVSEQFPNTIEANRLEELRIAKLCDQGNFFEAEMLIQKIIAQQRDSTDLQRLIALTKQFTEEMRKAELHRLPPDFRPSAIPAWSAEYNLTEVSRELIEVGQRDLRENGLTPFSPWTAADSGENLITITPLQIEARDRSTGKLVWARDLPQYSSRILDELTAVDNPQRSWNIARQVLFRIFGESLYSSFSVDGQHVYFVEETPTGAVLAPSDSQRRKAANQIVCLDATTGNEVWKNDSLEESRVHLCSPPEIWGNEILMLAEFRHAPQIYLIALDRNSGELTRTLPLADIARRIEAKPKENPDRRRDNLACPIRIVNSKAYCPTGAGLLAAVDLLDWSVDWVYRYPRHDVQRSGTGILHPKLGHTGYQWWNGWHEIQTIFFDDYVAFASPESQRLTLLDLQSGELLWTTDRQDGLYVAAATVEEGIVVIGSNFARALSFDSGDVLWETPLNFPTGRGVQVGKSYLLPDSERGWALLDLKTGMLTSSPLNLNSEFGSYYLPDVSHPRNLVAIDDELYELSYRGIKRLQSILQDKDRFDFVSESDRIIHQIELDSAGERIKTADLKFATGQSDTFLKQLVEQTLLKQVSGHEPAEILRQGFYPASKTLQLNWFCTVFAGALDQRDMSTIRELMTTHLSISMLTEFKTNRTVQTRLDHWILAALLDAYSRYSETDRVALAESLRMAMNSRLLDQPTEQQLFADFFTGTPWQFDLSEKLNQRPELRDVIKTQLQQIEQRARENLFVDQGSERTNKWGNQEPEIHVQSRLSANVFFESVPIDNIDGTKHTALNLEIEFPGHRAVRFSGKYWQRPWPAYLPRTDRSLRLENELVKAWAIGKLIVFQVGSEVYGFSPLTVEGNRGAKLLWPSRGESIDTLGDRSNQMLSFETKMTPELIGFPQSATQRVNEFDYFATEVGPVRAGYFCIQQKGMLVAFDTATGLERWRRFDLPREAKCLGDEENVVVLDRTHNRIQVLSALDGRERQVRHEFPIANRILHSSGIYYLTESGDQPAGAREGFKQQLPKENLTLKWIDSVTGQIVWQRSWDEPAIPFELDGRWLGVCTVAGNIEILVVDSGKTLNTHRVELPAEISKIACHAGNDNILILISGKVADKQLTNATQQNQGYRRSIVNGPVFCIDRNRGDLLWSGNLENTLFPIDQPVDLPVFVTAERRFPEEIMDQRSPGSRIQVFDRRNGNLLYKTESLSSSVRYSVSGHLDSEQVVLTTRESVVTFDFGGHDK